MGSAHTKPPIVEMVLESLASDSCTYDNSRSYEDWLRETGGDDGLDERATYVAAKTTADKLKHLLGEWYDTLLYEVFE